MNVVAVVLTRNAISTGREQLLRDTVASLAAEARVRVVDNHSTDGTASLVSAHFDAYCSTDRLTTCGHGTNLCARVALGMAGDVCVLSDDDMLWQPGWAQTLRDWWAAAPEDIVLTGCHIEPLYAWNAVACTEEHGGVRGLIRASTGAASWSFRAADWRRIGPIPERVQGVGDVPACERILQRGHRIAQLDLATHQGVHLSTWGNRTVEMYGWDVEPARRLLLGGTT